MRKKILQRGLVMVLSTAMLLTGVQIPSMTVRAAQETIVDTDTMDSKHGWTEEWSKSESEGERKSEVEEVNDGVANTSNAWNIWSASAQTVTFSKTVDLEPGTYTASVEIVGDNITSGKISIYEGTTEKGKKSMESFGSWPEGKNGEWATTTTSTAVIEGDSLTIKIEMNLADYGWFWMDNVVLKKVVHDEIVENADVNVTKVNGITDDFVLGVDISTYKSLIDSGVTFKDWDGNVLDELGFFQLLKDAGVNCVRIRVWNDPYADEAKTQGYGAGNCDVAKAAEMGAWATEAGLTVMIDFHYSDFWADPGRQLVPKAWEGLTVDEKAVKVEEFTRESLNTIIAAGVDVRMVQVGNETNNAVCGEEDWADRAKIFKAGCKAVKSVNPDIQTVLHFTDPQEPDTIKGFAQQLKDNSVEYDIFASSYYPYWHGTRENLTSVLKSIAETYDKKVMVAETSWASTMEDGDGQPNVVRHGQNDDTSVYPATPQGQANEVRDVIEAVVNVGDAGIGVMYWEPAWIPVHVYDAGADNADEVLAKNKAAWDQFGSGWASVYSIEYDTNVDEYNYGGSEWDNQAMFDFEGNPLPSLNVFQYVFTGAPAPDPLYKVTYHMDNGVNAAANPVEFDGTKDIALADPSREGYAFKGWYTDSAFVNKITKITKGTQTDLNLYAKWEKIVVNPPTPTEYNIAYILNGGTNNAANPSTYTQGRAVTIQVPTRTGYTFKGWYTDAALTIEFAGITAETTGDVTLHAKWVKVSVAKASVKSVKNNAKKKVKVTIKKVTGAKGYRIQYSTDKKFKKSVKTKTTTKTSLTLSGLKKGKTYYVRVCAYKMDSKNKRVYGKYGAAKNVKIKK